MICSIIYRLIIRKTFIGNDRSFHLFSLLDCLIRISWKSIFLVKGFRKCLTICSRWRQYIFLLSIVTTAYQIYCPWNESLDQFRTRITLIKPLMFQLLYLQKLTFFLSNKEMNWFKGFIASYNKIVTLLRRQHSSFRHYKVSIITLLPTLNLSKISF